MSLKPFKAIPFVFFFMISVFSQAQEQSQEHYTEQSQQNAPGQEPVIYTFIYNIAPDGYQYPLVGFFNTAKGDHQSLQMGFINTNIKSFTGVQMAFINTVGGFTSGLQMGYINTSAKGIQGAQLGFINTSGSSVKGVQMGFVNTSAAQMTGSQLGFVNTAAGESTGNQMGFVNTAAQSHSGPQLGFVNTARKRMNGLQAGFVNTAGKLSGTQLGFINIVDSLESGFPLGFLSIVRQGGYKAIEVFASEMHPYNASFKIGVRPVYTFFSASYNPEHEHPLAFGFGIGSIIPLFKALYFNPEYASVSTVNRGLPQHYYLNTKIGYSIGRHFYVAAGPSLVWSHTGKRHPLQEPLFTLSQTKIDERNHLTIGARFALGFAF